MSKNRLPDALPVVPVQLDLNEPGTVEKLFYGERQQPNAMAGQPAEPVSPVASAEPRAPRKRAAAKGDAPDVTADDFAEALERLKALGPRGERPHHVHLPDALDITLRRFAADRKTKATNILIVALMAYLDERSAR